MAVELTKGSEIQATRLPGGLFVITETLSYLHSVTLGFGYRVGSRDDPLGGEGIAHLIEHMIFKGTEELDARRINIIAETHGAELNGFTDKEGTCFYARFPSDQTDTIVDLMGKILSTPAFAETELSKEKEVVSEEIRASDEDPESCAFNLLLRVLFGDTPLGRPGIGTLDSIVQIGRTDLLEFYKTYYSADAGVVVGVGDINHNQLLEKLAGFEGRKGIPPQRQGSIFRNPGVLTRTRPDISQVHLCLGVPTFAHTDPRRYALSVLNTALGGGVSSRLFQRLREEEGLVYAVGSFAELFQDAGFLCIYLSAERQKLPRCVEVLKEEISRFKKDRINREEFGRAMTMTRSAILLGMETPLNRMLRLSRGYLILGRVQTGEEIISALNQVTLEEVNGLIDEVLNGAHFYASAVGPVEQPEIQQLIFEKGEGNGH